jgi:hypothetical protein
MMLDHPYLHWNPWLALKLTGKDRPFVVIDGVLTPRDGTGPIVGEAAYVSGVAPPDLPPLLERLDAEYLYIDDVRAADLSPLARLPRLRHLRIEINTKLTDLAALGRLDGLRTLILHDVPKVTDLAPLTTLRALEALELSLDPRHSKKIVLGSLAPLAALPALRELTLLCISTPDDATDGIRALARCAPTLERLSLSNQFDTEDFAYLSVALPNVACALFAPWFSFKLNTVDGDRPMCGIVGRRKPFLDPSTDADRIAGYERAFAQLQQRFRATVAAPQKH